jgi:hypothetical protein
VPLIVTKVPTCAVAGLTDEILGLTVKAIPLLAKPPTVTTMLPVVAAAGTGTVMLVALHAVGVAAAPLNVTVLLPCVAPNAVPLMVTLVPVSPEIGDRDETAGATEKVIPLLAAPPTLTTTLPVVAIGGTGTVMLVLLQAVAVAGTPLNVTVFEPWLAPKFVPVMVTLVPVGPDVGDSDEIPGATVNANPLLATLLTVTTTLPVVAPVGTGTTMLVALHDVGVAVMLLLNLTVLEPWLAPNALPLIVTLAAIGAGDGVIDEIDGLTVNVNPLLAMPTVTTTLPVVAPAGTGTTMLVALHEVGVEVTPLNFTVLEP